MLTPLMLASVFALAPGSGSALPCLVDGPTPVDETYRQLYESGRSYSDFLGAATRRTELWHGNSEKAEGVDAELVRRARAVSGTWHFLAVAVDSCSDSVSTIPYLAELVSLVDGLDLRIIDSTVGRSIMESHRTSDGRPATPTVLLLDEGFDEVGCFIERPPTLKTWILENESLSSDEIYESKMEWYADDSGQDTLETFVKMLEAATSGEVICG